MEATQHLTAKLQVVSEQLKTVETHFDSLIVKGNLIDEHSERICCFVTNKFDVLKHALDKKEKELISNILDETSHVKKDLDSAKRSAEVVIGKSLQVGEIITIDSLKECCCGNEYFLNNANDPSSHHTKFEIFLAFC